MNRLHRVKANHRLRAVTETSGQALVELAMGIGMLCVFALGIIDVSRAIYYRQVLESLAGQGATMAARTAKSADTANKVIANAGSDLAMSTAGCVIVTAVTNTNTAQHPLQVTDQAKSCGISASSQIGCMYGVGGCATSNATIPASAASVLQLNQAIYVTEIYYNYGTVTPLPKFITNLAMPSQLYAVGYQ